MAENQNLTVEVTLDVGKIESELKDISSSISGVKTAIIILKNTIAGGFATTQTSLNNIETCVSNEGKAEVDSVNALASIVAVCTDNIIREINNNFSALFKSGAEEAAVNAGYKAGDWLLQIIGNMSSSNSKNGDGTSGTSKDSGKEQPVWQSWELPTCSALPEPSKSGQLALPPGNSDSTNNSGGNSSVSGIVSSAFANAGGSVGDIMDFGASADDLIQGIGNVAAKLKESAAAWGGADGGKNRR